MDYQSVWPIFALSSRIGQCQYNRPTQTFRRASCSINLLVRNHSTCVQEVTSLKPVSCVIVLNLQITELFSGLAGSRFPRVFFSRSTTTWSIYSLKGYVASVSYTSSVYCHCLVLHIPQQTTSKSGPTLHSAMAASLAVCECAS